MSVLGCTPWSTLGFGLQGTCIRRELLLLTGGAHRECFRGNLRRTLHATAFYLTQTQNDRTVNGRRTARATHPLSGISRERRDHVCFSTKTTRSRKSRKPRKPDKKIPDDTPKLVRIDLSDADIAAIFGETLDRQEGNELLSTLQHQRKSGTLDEPVDASPHDMMRALAWLRLKYPVDEDQAIIRRLEREEAEDRREAENIRRNYKPQHFTKSAPTSTRSVIEEIREKNRKLQAKEEKEMEKKEEKRKKKQEELRLARLQSGESIPEETQIEEASGRALVSRAPEPEWVKRYREGAMVHGKEPPNMTKTQRLWPSAAFTLVTIGLSILFAQTYVPPSREARLWPNIPPAAATLNVIVGINGLFFILWRIPPAWKLLIRYFTSVHSKPVAFSMLGNIFSHQGVKHMAKNTPLLWLMGTQRKNPGHGRTSSFAF